MYISSESHQDFFAGRINFSLINERVNWRDSAQEDMNIDSFLD